MSDGGGVATLRNRAPGKFPNAAVAGRRDVILSLTEPASNDVAPVSQDEQSNTLTLKCGECTDSFSALSELSTHLQHLHKDIEVYECGVCLRFYLLHPELENHMLEEHLITEPGENQIIKTNTQVVEEDISRFLSHSEERERVELQCPFCPNVYNKLALYQLHMSNSHKNKAWDKDGLCSAVLKVTVMGPKKKSIPPNINTEEDSKIAGKVYVCGRCNKKVYGREPMKRHAATHLYETFYRCSTCTSFFSTKEKLETHLTSAHLTIDNLNIKQNKHGDMIGRSIDDILNANDCLAATTPTISADEETVIVDIDTVCTVTHETVMIPVENTPIDTGSSERPSLASYKRPSWLSHKRTASEDSLPDTDHPLYDMMVLCRCADRERKRLANSRNTDNTKNDKTSHSKKDSKTEPMTERQQEVNYANWILSIHRLLSDLAALSCFVLNTTTS